ncbi:MAG TPA: 30S ribosomal protein S16 [Negativicutes bacterium]|nr:30S ribosomal protein S16 [Negativicutes bacterium]
MLTIRLTRKGKKNQPFFRVVVIDKRRSSKGGRAVEEVGYVDPLAKRNSLKKERILHWIKNGAKPTPRIHNLLVSEKIIDAPKIKTFSVTKKAKAALSGAKAAATPAVVEAPAPEAPKEEPKPEEKPVA